VQRNSPYSLTLFLPEHHITLVPFWPESWNFTSQLSRYRYLLYRSEGNRDDAKARRREGPRGGKEEGNGQEAGDFTSHGTSSSTKRPEFNLF